ncbi:Protein of unknown function [Nitrosomonas marina]|uniref:DUF3617 domain-containing protein n=2 Tax=Nitrosomonas marina TaxID=917 RepID=A0A1I0B6P5_9PROT|nr:Protein of unknown function [Nitrosomonas marina]
MRRVFFFIFCFVFTVMPAAAEQYPVRPGLWEVMTTSDLLSLVPHIPSGQMRQITDLAGQYGLILPEIKDNAAVSQICITPAMAKQEIPVYFYDSQSGCSVKNASRSGDRFQLELACDNPQFQGDGIAEGVFTSPEQFSGHTEFDSLVMGAPVFATAQTRAQWVGDVCTVNQPAMQPPKTPEFFPLR